jgi:MYXO-CTERM domain-containing protein
MKTLTLTTASLLLAASLAAPAHAAITSVSGQTTYLNTPPASCTFGSLTGFTAYAWDEQQNFTTTGLYMDETQNPGGNATPIPGTLPGTYASHFIHFEPLPGAIGASGTVTFSDPIVGIMFVNTSLDNSDALCGAGGTTYPTTFPFRGLNSASTVSYIGNTLNFNIWVAVPTSDVGQIRVITHTPAPGAAALLGLGGLCMTRRRRAV